MVINDDPNPNPRLLIMFFAKVLIPIAFLLAIARPIACRNHIRSVHGPTVLARV